MKSVTLPAGKYKLEAWGASGGGRNPGKGGYSAGTVTFANETTVYIVAGQSAGTYNGGGIGCHGYGGGATHFATANGELAALSNNKNSVLLVAGGGAGGSSGAGGAGGGANQSGTTGGNGCGTKGEGATVSGPGNAYFSGSFGKGGSNSGWNTCGGGGGLYGGGGSYESYSRNDDDDAGAGGGSGFASPSLTDVSGITGEHSGNGYAKITVIEAHTDYDPDKVFDLVKKATGNNYSLIPNSASASTTAMYARSTARPLMSCSARNRIIRQLTERLDITMLAMRSVMMHVIMMSCIKRVQSRQMQENRERPSHWNLEISSCLITIFIFTSQTVAIFMSQMIMESPRPNSGREKDMRIIMTARSGPGRNGSNFRLLYFIIGPLME